MTEAEERANFVKVLNEDIVKRAEQLREAYGLSRITLAQAIGRIVAADREESVFALANFLGVRAYGYE